ncbi:MAG: molybdate ABC transporter substrate-binding protein [Planctomycetota bacterium]|jgi:molybdate transport system substrate-binding protein
MRFLPLLVLVLVGCSKPADDGNLRVFAAASLTDVAQKLDSDAVWNHAGSSTLARQIEDEAPCDVFLSANRLWVDHLVATDAASGKPVRIAGNALILAAAEGSNVSANSLTDLSDVGRIGVADPSVPAGRYARDWLGDTKLNLVSLGDVRSVRRAIANDEVDAGFIYATDAGDLKTVLRSDLQVDYFALVIRDSRQANEFISMLQNERSRETLKQLGFTVDD